MRPLKSIALLALAIGAAGFAQAGVYVEMADRQPGAAKTTVVQKMYVQGTSGRFVDLSRDAGSDAAQESVTVIKDGTLYAIDDADKSYVMLDKASMDQLGKKLSAGLEQMKAQLAKMPPDQREQMEQMLAKQIPGFGAEKWTVEAVDTGKSDKVDGRACRVWDVKRNGVLDEQLCVVPFNALPGKENFQAVFGNFAKVFEEMAKTAPMLAGLMSNEFAAQEKINGFPVRSRDYENGKLSDIERVMSVWREQEVPASMFQIPAGYKRKTMEEMAGQ